MKAITLFTLLSIASLSWGQSDSSQQLAIRSVVDQLFDGMRLGDSTLVRSVFHVDARGYTSYKKGDEFVLHAGSIDDFVKAIGKPHKEVWDERISNVVIQMDGGLAQVWMDYAFYLGDTFSHSGVNAMQLAFVDGRWQIIHIADTRRRS